MTITSLTKRRLLAALGWLLALSCGAVSAQSQLPPTVTLLVGYAPGGSVDAISRVLAQALQEELKTTVIVENKAGAGGRIAAAQFKRAATDGSVVMIAPNALTTVQSLVYADKIAYNVVKDFVPLARLVSVRVALTVPGTSNVKTPADLRAWLKANPDQGNFGVPSMGGMAHFAGLLFAKASDVRWTPVAYQGGPPLLTDLIGGRITGGVDALTDHMEHSRSGKVRVLGIFSQNRSTLAPEIPTLREQGVNVMNVDVWYGAFVPAGTPQRTIDVLEAALKKISADKNYIAQAQKLVLEPSFLGGAEFRQLQADELAQWAPIIRESGFKPE